MGIEKIILIKSSLKTYFLVVVASITIMIQPCQSLLGDGANEYCPVQRKVVFVQQVHYIAPEEINGFEQLVNVMLSKTCITSISILAIDFDAKIHHYENWEQFQSVPSDPDPTHIRDNTHVPQSDINEFVNEHIFLLESQKKHNADNTVFIIAIRGRNGLHRDLVATFVKNFGKGVKLIFLCRENNWSQLFGLVPFHRIILSWNYMSTGKNSFNMIADLALNPDYDRYKMAEYFAPHIQFTESCFTHKNVNNINITTTTSTVLYVWLIHTYDYFPQPEITPLVQLLILFRRKLYDVGSRLEIVTHIKHNNLKIAFESFGFVCHPEPFKSNYHYGWMYDFRSLFSDLIPKYNELENNNKADQKNPTFIRKKFKKLHLNINKFGSPRSTMAQFTDQFVSIRYNPVDDRNFWLSGNQLLVTPLDLAKDKTIEALMKFFDKKACALS